MNAPGKDGATITTVTAMEIEVPGSPEALRPISRPMPQPIAGEVRVRAEAIGVSSADLMIRKGLYKWMPPLPAVLGNELAGVIDAVGEGVPEAELGRRVLVSSRELPTRGGCYVEAICVPAGSVFALPDGISAEAAVAMPNYQLAWALLYASGVLPPRSILVYGASGGVGLALAQLALAEGMRAIGVVSSEEKRRFAERAGLPEVLMRGEGFADRLRDLTAGEGVDVVYAHGGADFADNLDHLRPLGTLVSFSPLGGIPETNLFAALRERMGKSPGIRVYSLHTLDADTRTRRKAMEHVIAHAAAGRLVPPPPMCWPLTRAADAHAAMEARETIGKVVLIPGD